MLGAAAVFNAQFVVALALGEAGGIDQVKVHLTALARRPFGDQLAFASQLRYLLGVELRRVADPDIQIALLGLADSAAAAHQIEAVDLTAEAGGVTAILEAASQALGNLLTAAVRLKAVQATGSVARDETGEQGVVDVEQQRQQLQYVVLSAGQRLQHAAQARGVDRHKAFAQGVQSLAVNAFVNPWLNLTLLHG